MTEGAGLHPEIAISGKCDERRNPSKDCKSSDCKPDRPGGRVVERHMTTEKNRQIKPVNRCFTSCYLSESFSPAASLDQK